jgi:glycosyltransferase involved in cell wall biosynthesis
VAKNIRSGSDYYHQFLMGIEFPGKWMLYQKWIKTFPGGSLRNQKNTIEILKHESFDIFHPTDVDDYFLEYLGDRPLVITIHDMIDEYFPEYSFHVHSNYKSSIKQKLVERASGIIAVSESTKHDLIERFNVDEKKIKVIYHGVSELEEEPDDAPLLTEKYFLYVGKRVHYKNFYFFLQCVQSFLKKDKSLKIVCVGAPFNKVELEYFNDLNIADNLIFMNASDKVLGNLYRNARAFVYPSLYEGFGIPILEAFKYGCPVILSNASSLPEVAGDAGLYFHPKDIHSVQQAFVAVMEDDNQRELMIKKGYNRLRNFSWKKTVASTIDFYKDIA